MAIIDSISWQPPDNNALAYRYPEENLSTFTQLIVNESQEAVLFSKGQILGKFGPGKHTLSTENLPLLRNLFGIPFGGKNPFQSVVVFVNKSIPPDNPLDYEEVQHIRSRLQRPYPGHFAGPLWNRGYQRRVLPHRGRQDGKVVQRCRPEQCHVGRTHDEAQQFRKQVHADEPPEHHEHFCLSGRHL